MFCTPQDVHPSKHQHLSSIYTPREENNVQALKAVLKPYNLVCDDGKQLFNFITILSYFHFTIISIIFQPQMS